MTEWMTEWELINSYHLWSCAQPASLDLGAAAYKTLTPVQHKEREQLAQMACFGWRSPIPGFYMIDSNLPRYWKRGEKPRPFRCIILAETGSPTSGLGELDQFPIEILNAIISVLDISATDQFKAANRRSYEVVNNHPQFKIINEQAHDTLRGLRAIKTSHLITVQTLFDKLCTSQCSQCADFGGYMYLITFERVCCRCFTEKARYLPLREIEALKKFGLSLEILDTLPRSQSYPGSYGVGCFQVWKPHIELVDRESARSAGIVRYGSLEAMQEHVANADPKIWKSCKRAIQAREEKLSGERALKEREKRAKWNKLSAYKREVLRRREEREIRKVQGTASTEGVEVPSEDTDNESISTLDPRFGEDDDSDDYTKGDSNDKRPEGKEIVNEAICGGYFLDEEEYERTWFDDDSYRALIRVPWLNRKSGRDEWGFHCIGCEGLFQWPNHINRDFIMSTFREHLKECGPIRGGVHHTTNCCENRTCRKKDDPPVVFENRLYCFWGMSHWPDGYNTEYIPDIFRVDLMRKEVHQRR